MTKSSNGTKNSTKSVSLKNTDNLGKDKRQKKFITRTVSGLIFYPKDGQCFVSLKAWVEAGCPDNARVYDTVDALVYAGFKLSDARLVNGIFIRKGIAAPVKCKLDIGFSLQSRQPEITTKAKGIRANSGLKTNKMSYG